MEKFCPACSRVYNEDAAVCEIDGERLVLLSEEPSLVGHVLDGKYTLISKLGEGGMGSVYLAEQATMGREVAIKVLRREFSQNRMAIKRFLREARAASKLAHPNTITVYDFGQSNDGLLYLVMEKLTGRPLADILDSDGSLPVQRAVHILAQICDSLAEAHKNGITHRDLKPENIFIEEKVGNPDFVKVLDFGIAKMAGDETTTQATAAGMICGTPAYMSPEQAMGKEIDGRSDIYALGVLLYEMLTNEKPFEGDTPMEVMLKHINEPSPDIYQRTQIQVPQGVQDAVDKLLAKKPDGRPSDCQIAKKLLVQGLETPLVGPVLSTNDPNLPRKRREETNERMQSLEKTGLSPAIAASRPQRVETPRRRPTWAWAAAVVALVGVASAVILLAASGDDAREGSLGDPLAAAEPGTRAPATVVTEPSTPPEPTPGAVGTAPPEQTPGAVGTAPVAPRPSTPEPATRQEPEAAQPVAVKAGEVAGEVVDDAARRVAETLTPEPVKAADKVKIQVTAKPIKAEVYEGEALIGTTPLTFQRDKDSGSVKLTVKARGYRSQEIVLGTVADLSTTVELKRVAGSGHAGTRPPRDPKGTDDKGGGLGGTF